MWLNIIPTINTDDDETISGIRLWYNGFDYFMIDQRFNVYFLFHLIPPIITRSILGNRTKAFVIISINTAIYLRIIPTKP